MEISRGYSTFCVPHGHCQVNREGAPRYGDVMSIASIIDDFSSSPAKRIDYVELDAYLAQCLRNLESGLGHTEAISSSFFDEDQIQEVRTAEGIVETPFDVARYIVQLAFERWQAANSDTPSAASDLRWLDPCSGSGVFAREILQLYFVNFGSKLDRLPFITVVEKSKKGMVATLCMMKHTLEERGLTFVDYCQSGKLNIRLVDTLSLLPEQMTLFDDDVEFDLVVGNPPYVRATRLSSSYKAELMPLFPSVYSGNADLYTYFIASGISHLAEKGVLTFISSAAFTKATNGKRLRQWLAPRTSIDTFIDLDETRVFADAALHSAIYVLVKSPPKTDRVNYLHVSTLESLRLLLTGDVELQKYKMSLQFGNWGFHASTRKLNELDRAFSGCVPLNEIGVTVYSGIRTGYSKAFIVDQSVYDSFSSQCQSRWFRTIVLAPDIVKWSGMKSKRYMLVVPHDTPTIDDELLLYLERFRETLESRPEVSSGTQWFALRPCRYYEKMEHSKIVFPDLSARQRFSLLDPEIYVPDGAYFLDSCDLVLLGILNSSLAKKYFVRCCSSVGNLESKGRFRFKKAFLQKIPVPQQTLGDSLASDRIRRHVKQIIDHGESTSMLDKLDHLVDELYELA
jgi:hypothetical protein